MYKIPLIKPYLPEGTKEKVLEVLDSGYLTEGAVMGKSNATMYIGLDVSEEKNYSFCNKK